MAHPDIQSHTSSNRKWRITTRKCPILKADPIDNLTRDLGIPIPEMIFGDNYICIEHIPSQWKLDFNARDALDRVSKTSDGMLQVAYSREWQKDRQHHQLGIKEVVKPFDWSYSTDYRGTTSSADADQVTDIATSVETSTRSSYRRSDADTTWQSSTQTSTPIRTDLLSRPDPIVFFDQVTLYEDELADNGIAVLSAKIRVMPERLLLLCRFHLRLDGVIVRLRDTRVYIELDSDVVVRQYTAKEETYDALKHKLAAQRENVPEAMRDPGRVGGLMSVVEDTIDVCRLGT